MTPLPSRGFRRREFVRACSGLPAGTWSGTVTRAEDRPRAISGDATEPDWEQQAKSRVGILIGAETRDVRCEDNQIAGFSIPIKDLRHG